MANRASFPRKRRPVNNWSSSLVVDKKLPKPTSIDTPRWSLVETWQVKKYNWRVISRWQILISLHRTKSRHHAPRLERVFHPKFLPIKEIRWHIKHLRVQKRPPKTITIVIQQRMLALYILILLGIIGTLFFGFRLNSHRLPPPKAVAIPAPPITTDYSKPITLARSIPTQIRISKINLDTKIVEVGRQADGTIETPNVLDYVTGWYKYSPTPGELGPSVIVGHVDSYKGISVFWRLRELEPGDGVDITRADGSTASFKVLALQQFDQSSFPTEAVYGNIPYAGLRLITCGGTFNTQTGHYDQNTVVFARLVSS